MTSPAPLVPDEVRPPAYLLAPRLTRRIGYVAAPVVLAVVGGVAWVVQAVTR